MAHGEVGAAEVALDEDRVVEPGVDEAGVAQAHALEPRVGQDGPVHLHPVPVAAHDDGAVELVQRHVRPAQVAFLEGRPLPRAAVQARTPCVDPQPDGVGERAVLRVRALEGDRLEPGQSQVLGAQVEVERVDVGDVDPSGAGASAADPGAVPVRDEPVERAARLRSRRVHGVVAGGVAGRVGVEPGVQRVRPFPLVGEVAAVELGKLVEARAEADERGPRRVPVVGRQRFRLVAQQRYEPARLRRERVGRDDARGLVATEVRGRWAVVREDRPDPEAVGAFGSAARTRPPVDRPEGQVAAGLHLHRSGGAAARAGDERQREVELGVGAWLTLDVLDVLYHRSSSRSTPMPASVPTRIDRSSASATAYTGSSIGMRCSWRPASRSQTRTVPS